MGCAASRDHPGPGPAGWAAAWAAEEAAAPLCLRLMLPVEVWGEVFAFGEGRERKRGRWHRGVSWEHPPSSPERKAQEYAAHHGVSREYELVRRLTQRGIAGTAWCTDDVLAAEDAVGRLRRHGLRVRLRVAPGIVIFASPLLSPGPNGRHVAELSLKLDDSRCPSRFGTISGGQLCLAREDTPSLDAAPGLDSPRDFHLRVLELEGVLLSADSARAIRAEVARIDTFPRRVDVPESFSSLPAVAEQSVRIGDFPCWTPLFRVPNGVACEYGHVVVQHNTSWGPDWTRWTPWTRHEDLPHQLHALVRAARSLTFVRAMFVRWAGAHFSVEADVGVAVFLAQAPACRKGDYKCPPYMDDPTMAKFWPWSRYYLPPGTTTVRLRCSGFSRKSFITYMTGNEIFPHAGGDAPVLEVIDAGSRFACSGRGLAEFAELQRATGRWAEVRVVA